MLPEDFEGRLEQIRAQIAAAAARSGRHAGAVTLVAVTKTHPAELVRAAYQQGLRDFGENRVAELVEKQDSVVLPHARWHFVGHIQRRKAKELVGRCHLIHSIDRLSLAQELSKRANAAEVDVAGLLQVNTSGEETKGGWDCTTEEGCEGFLREVAEILELPNLSITGLMTMAPFYDDAERTRPTFAAVRAVRERLVARFPEHTFDILSMGMTNDFPVAIEEGATHVRIGTALFGAREE